MTTPVDLDHLEKLHAEATQGEWTDYCWSDVIAITRGAVKVDTQSEQVHICEMRRGPAGDADCRAIAATHNALPALIAEVRALRAFVQEVRETAEDMPPSDAYVGYAPLTHGRLRAALAKVPR